MKRALNRLCHHQLNTAAGFVCVSKSEDLSQHGMYS